MQIRTVIVWSTVKDHMICDMIRLIWWAQVKQLGKSKRQGLMSKWFWSQMYRLGLINSVVKIPLCEG